MHPIDPNKVRRHGHPRELRIDPGQEGVNLALQSVQIRLRCKLHVCSAAQRHGTLACDAWRLPVALAQRGVFREATRKYARLECAAVVREIIENRSYGHRVNAVQQDRPTKGGVSTEVFVRDAACQDDPVRAPQRFREISCDDRTWQQRKRIRVSPIECLLCFRLIVTQADVSGRDARGRVNLCEVQL